MTKICGFVSHAFDDSVYEGGRDAFRRSVGDLLDKACADFASDKMSVEHELFFEATPYGEPLMPWVRDQIRSCDFLIADITQPDPTAPVNPNVMYEIGFAMALRKRILVIRRNTMPLPPSDIGDLLAGTYDSLDGIIAKFETRMIEIITDTLAKATKDSERIRPFIRKMWFPVDTRAVSIICACEGEPSKFSNRREANYVHIDKFEDRDALIELAVFFARRYPDANFVRYLCDDLPHEAMNGDLVVLGGPGCVVGEGNKVCRDLMEMLKSRVHYPESGDGLVWGEEPLRETRFDDDGCVLEDWGSVLAAPNPYNPSARVILLHGTTTYGTLGAAIALTDSASAMRNHLFLDGLNITDRLTGAVNFEALVKVEVDSNRRIRPTKLDIVSRIEN